MLLAIRIIAPITEEAAILVEVQAKHSTTSEEATILVLFMAIGLMEIISDVVPFIISSVLQI